MSLELYKTLFENVGKTTKNNPLFEPYNFLTLLFKNIPPALQEAFFLDKELLHLTRYPIL